MLLFLHSSAAVRPHSYCTLWYATLCNQATNYPYLLETYVAANSSFTAHQADQAEAISGTYLARIWSGCGESAPELDQSRNGGVPHTVKGFEEHMSVNT